MKLFNPKIYKRRRIIFSFSVMLLVFLSFYIFKTLDNSLLQISLGYLYILCTGFLIYQLEKWHTDVFQGEQLILSSNNRLVQWIGWSLYFTLIGWMIYSNYGTATMAFIRNYFPGFAVLLLIRQFWLPVKEEPKLLFQAGEWWLFSKKSEPMQIEKPLSFILQAYNLEILTSEDKKYNLLNLRLNKSNLNSLQKFAEEQGISFEKDG